MSSIVVRVAVFTLAAVLGWTLDGAELTRKTAHRHALADGPRSCLDREVACASGTLAAIASASASATPSPFHALIQSHVPGTSGASGSSAGGASSPGRSTSSAPRSSYPRSSPKSSPKSPTNNNGGGGTVDYGDESPGWKVACDYSHSLKDDPIVAPGQPGASHLHDFLGGRTTGTSTYNSMVSGPTSCGLAQDTAGYWVPALYRDGVKVNPGGSFEGEDADQRVYYRDDNLNPGTVIQPIPKDLRIVLGNAKATSESANSALGSKVYYGCSDDSAEHQKAPPSSCPTGLMTLKVRFPNCWDGVRLDSADHLSHMAYPSSGKCPSSHPVPLPRITLRLEYPVSRTTGGITLSSGPYYTAHGDFWNTWNQPKLEQLTRDCLNSNRDCGTFK